MTPRVQMILDRPGLIVDNFAGGGGASTGIEAAIGRSVDIAINHDPEAIAMHKANHPNTRHYCQDVWEVDPVEATRGDDGRPQLVRLAWFSPDCKHFSKAKGGKPREKKIRDLAWVVHRWVEALRPYDAHPVVIMLENVEEFRTWGPLLDDGKPCPARKGETFAEWCQQLRDHGYAVQWRELKACDYGAPTSRKRLFLIARRDGEPIVWPEPTHGPLRSHRYRTAADIIDWSLPCPSIFERARPLKDATCRRIATGIMRYVINCQRPFILPITHTGGERVHSIDEPLRTITTAQRGELALISPHVSTMRNSGKPTTAAGEPMHTIVADGAHKTLVSAALVGVGGRRGQSAPADVERPYPTITAKADGAIASATLIQTGYGEREGQQPRVPGLGKPLGTIVAGGGKHALVAAFMAQHNAGNTPRPKRMDEPVSTITGRGTQQQLVTSNLIKLQNNQDAKPVDAPIDTVLAGGQHYAEVRAFLIKYYGNERDGHTLFGPLGTVTTRDRFGVVTVTIDGVDYAISDIGMRMLTAPELFAAQGFPSDYTIDFDFNGKPLTKTAAVRMVGNSVCPPLPSALVRANLPQLCEPERVAA